MTVGSESYLWDDVGRMGILFVIVYGAFAGFCIVWDFFIMPRIGRKRIVRYKYHSSERLSSVSSVNLKHTGKQEHYESKTCDALLMGESSSGGVEPMRAVQNSNRSLMALKSFVRWFMWYHAWAEAVLSLIACVLFVWRAETKSFPLWMRRTELGLDLFFCTHFAMRLMDAVSAMRFALSARCWIDILAITSSLYCINENVWLGFSFLRAFMLREALQTVDLGKALGLADFAKQLETLATNFTLMIFSFSCAIFLLENLGEVPWFEDHNSENWDIINSVYFIFTTISTVGYGDFAPVTVFGRVATIVFLCLGIGVFTDGLHKLIDLSNERKYGRGKFVNRKGDPFVLVCGSPSFDMIKDFLSELYHPERCSVSVWTLRRQVVILSNSLADVHSLRAFIRSDPLYHGRVSFLFGTPLQAVDLFRADAADAEACFVMNAIECEKKASGDDDMATVLRAISLKRHCPRVPMFVLLQSYRSKRNLLSSNTPFEHVAFRDQLNLGILALSCIAPGFTTLMYNLVKTRAVSKLKADVSEDSWLAEYLYGAAQEIYVVRLDPYFTGKPFSRVVEDVYNVSDGCIILCGIVHNGVKLNPSEDVPLGAFGLLVTESDADAERIGELSSPVSLIDFSASNTAHAGLIEDEEEEEMVAQDLPRPPPPAELKNHLIVACGETTSIRHFIEPLRMRERKLPGNLAQPIVILCETPLEPSDLHDVRSKDLKGVFFLQGSLSSWFCSRLNVQEADKVVVLSKQRAAVRSSEGQINDAKVIFNVMRLRHYLRRHRVEDKVFVIGETEQESAVKFLDMGENRKQQLFEAPSFASGSIAAGNVAHLIMTQTFFNPRLLSVVESFLHNQSHVFQISLDRTLKKFVGKSFGELFRHLLQEHEQIALALYRNGKHEECERVLGHPCCGKTTPSGVLTPIMCVDGSCSGLFYVYTCPLHSDLLCPFDKVFVLSQTEPQLATPAYPRSGATSPVPAPESLRKPLQKDRFLVRRDLSANFGLTLFAFVTMIGRLAPFRSSSRVVLRRSFANKVKTLKQRFSEKIPEFRETWTELRTNYGDMKLGTVTVDQATKGMRGVMAMVTDTSLLDVEEGVRFRGLSIPEIQERLPKRENEPLPEGLLWLLLTGEVPTKEEVNQLTEELHARARMPRFLPHLLEHYPKDMHPMAQFCSSILALGTESKFSAAYESGEMNKMNSWEYALEDSFDLIARLPEIAAMIYCHVFKPYYPEAYNRELDWGANLAHMMGFGTKEMHELFRLYLTIHSDHEGGNVSAHAGHLVGSAWADPYLACNAAMSGLAGPLHGLANQEVLRWILEFREKLGGDEYDDKDMIEHIWATLNSGHVIPGFGHAVLRKTDPRYMSQREFALKHLPDDPNFKLISDLFRLVPGILQEQGKVANPWPNVDAHSGVLLRHFGLKEMKFYTVLFGVARCLGICSNYVLNRAVGTPIERPKTVTVDWIKQECERRKKGEEGQEP